MPKPKEFNSNPRPIQLGRRQFIGAAAAASVMTLPLQHLSAALPRHSKSVTLGLIADVHQDIMHDGVERMKVFVDSMKKTKPDALIQLGDFAYPSDKNKTIMELYDGAHENTFHVIGNHDLDSGHTKAQCIKRWGILGRYYQKDLQGIRLLVLDGNDKGSPKHRGGYPSFVGQEQMKWLAEQLAKLDRPAIIVSHQPLAGTASVDNAEEIQALLSKHADKILLAINGHTHIDDLVRVAGVSYLHVNSASYKWVGGTYRHESYSADVHKKHPYISSTCPYKESLFTTLRIDLDNLKIAIEGRKTEWVGESPSELGITHPTLTDGEEIAPRIRERILKRAKKSRPK